MGHDTLEFLYLFAIAFISQYRFHLLERSLCEMQIQSIALQNLRSPQKWTNAFIQNIDTYQI